MLQQFSWASFLICFAILSAIWYIGLVITLYRKETMSLLLGAKLDDCPSGSVGEDNSLPTVTSTEQELMGKSRLPEGLETVSTSALSFHGSHAGYGTYKSKSEQIGLVPDVLKELKEIFAVLSREDGTKKDFLSLVGIIREKYGQIGSNPNIGQINEFIREHAPFAISNEELENLWD